LRSPVWICCPTLLLGGTEIHMLALARCLAESGYPIRVVVYHETDPVMTGRFAEAGIQVMALAWPRARGILGHLRLLWKLRRLFRQQHPKIVHVQYLAPGLVPILAARLAKVPVVLGTVHIAGSIVYGRQAKLLLRLAARCCDAFVCVSLGVERFWFGDAALFDPDRGPEGRRHFTIYNSVDTERIAQVAGAVDRSALRAELGLPSDSLVVGFVGRLTFQKGVPILLAAMAEICHELPRARLLVVGDGPDRAKLEKETVQLGLTGRVIWLGAQPPGRVHQLLGVLDVLAAPSLYEGFGLMAAEALAAGVPVVASRVEGLTEVVLDGEGGLLVPLADPIALTVSLRRLLSDPGLRACLGRTGTERAQHNFTPRRFSRAWSALYQSLNGRFAPANQR